MSWTSKQRLLAALRMEIPDRLPVTTHHVMPFFLRNAMNGMSVDEFFDDFGMDPIRWIVAHKPDESRGDYIDPKQGRREFLQPPRISAAGWRIETVRLPHPDYKTVHYTIVTPEKTLSMTLQSDDHTTWVTERLIKEKSDVETFAKYAPIPLCDVEEVNRQVTAQGEKGLIRGTVPGFDIYGQPGCWQDAAVLFGIERLILETYDDPEWVHTFLAILRDRKKIFIRSMKGAKFDLVELGGGDASSTVISPKIFDEFVALYDADLIEAAHQAGQKIVYHTCGGMMPLLESLADMNPDAVETFTPLALGGDTNLKEAKRSVASATASA
ncbi:MAG: uroporphyrinogen decarboxylase family protein [bacterium]